jgi:Rps23 Pro-64 3,4-dihydroxylase Tpa1-like proline 4-hydroxylase
MNIDRNQLATLISKRLSGQRESLQKQWKESGGSYFVIDDFLDPDLTREIFDRFPAPSTMMVRRSLREYKYVAAQMDSFDPILEEIVFGFQQPSVVDEVGQIVGSDDLFPDSRLYAGGISLMTAGQYLNPHLDNSHDAMRQRYRALNLLFYVTPNWKKESGGHLELWPQGVEGPQTVIESRFNRLVVMATNQNSWHSVSEVHGERRCCVSNYYFSDEPPSGREYFHVTSFRGRPEQPLRDLALRADAAMRSGIRKIFRNGIVETRHIYKK